jgi:hypothetical protein
MSARSIAVLVCLACLMTAQTVLAQEPAPQKNEKEMVPLSFFDDLRELHESAIFLMKRYATLQALVRAEELGRKENDAFLIGTSSVIPGVGQMINQDYTQGGILLFASSLSWTTAEHLSLTRPRYRDQEFVSYYYASLFLRNSIMTYAMLHASNASYRQNRNGSAALWTGSASLVPGVGQAINHDWWEAAGFFTAWAAAAFLTSYCQEQAFVDLQDKSYLVEKTEPLPLSVAWIPGGAALEYHRTW